VNVTDWPKTEVLVEEVSAVVVFDFVDGLHGAEETRC